MNLTTKARNTVTPYVLDIYDADLPEGTARVLGRCDTRTGEVWKTSGSKVPTSALREAVEASR